MTGDYLAAQKCAQALVGDSIELALPVMAHMRFIGGQIDANELLDTSPYSNFDAALVAYCQGDMARAETHFRACVEQDFAYGDAWSSKVFLRRIKAAKSQSQSTEGEFETQRPNDAE